MTTAQLLLPRLIVFVEDGSYLRISTITLGYTFPKKWLSKAFISNLRLYCTLNNPFTITNYSGYDPEVSKESFYF